MPVLSLTVVALIRHDTHWVHERGIIRGLFKPALENISTFSLACLSLSLSHTVFDQNGVFVWSSYCGSALIDLAGGLRHVLSTKIRAFSRSFTSRQHSLLPASPCHQYGTLPLVSSPWRNPSPCSTSPNSMTPRTKFPTFAFLHWKGWKRWWRKRKD